VRLGLADLAWLDELPAALGLAGDTDPRAAQQPGDAPTAERFSGTGTEAAEAVRRESDGQPAETACSLEVRQPVNEVRVRYIVGDVDAPIRFYTEMLGFRLDMHPAPGFAAVSRGNLRLLLNRPGAGGAGQAMPDGQVPAPGGWNRIQLGVDDLDATVDKLKAAGARLRNEIVTGSGGRQILVEDPSGNPIELFQPA
jgi:catechol 2,3-dioxygenase-like lactoylglutathione lyase family enzyme